MCLYGELFKSIQEPRYQQILLTSDNRMMYSLLQYALGEDNIEIRTHAIYALDHPSVSVPTFRYANSHTRTTQCKDRHTFNRTQVWHDYTVLILIRGTPSFLWGRLPGSQCVHLSQRTPV